MTPEQIARDPYNRLLARGPRFRVEGEIVRDIALAASGMLNPKIGGRSVMPPPPAFVFQGTADKWTPTETIKNFVELYREAGGSIELALFDGEPHAFVNDHPESPNSAKAVAMLTEFVRKFGAP